jgi:hypothetical protein
VWTCFCARFAFAHLLPQPAICKDDIFPAETKKKFMDRQHAALSPERSRSCPHLNIEMNWILSYNVKLTPIQAWMEARGGAMVGALRYKTEGCEIDSRWCNWNFSLT